MYLETLTYLRQDNTLVQGLIQFCKKNLDSPIGSNGDFRIVWNFLIQRP